MGWIVITGASRGLGLEFVTQYLREGRQVVAAARNPAASEGLKALGDAVEVHRLDVADAASCAAFGAAMKRRPVDLLVNNAGVYGPRADGVDSMDYDAWAQVLAVNTMGPLRVVQALADNLRAGKKAVVASVTSKMGSIADNTSGGAIIYRSSKAALNMVNRCVAHDLGREGITCVVLHPGWVRTDMGGPNGLIDAQESVTGMRAVIAGVTAADNGAFFNYDGAVIPW